MSSRSNPGTSGPLKSDPQRCAAAGLLLLASATLASANIDAPANAPGDTAEAQAPHQSAQASVATGRPTLDAAVVANRRPGKPKNVLRCWQEGRLILETGGLVPVGKSQSAIELKTVDGDGGSLQILDLKQGLCVLEFPAQRQ